MSEFGENTGKKRQADLAKTNGHLIIEKQCNTCTSEHRTTIDKLLAMGTSYAEISRAFGVSASSIGKHAKEHLNYEDAAIARIIEREANLLDQNVEEGVKGFLARRVYVETALQKAQSDLLSGETKVSARDAVSLIELGEKLDQKVYGATAEELRGQFAAFVQAIKEVLSPEQQILITNRTKELLGHERGQLTTPTP